MLAMVALVAPVALAGPASATEPATISGHITVPQELLDQAQNMGGIGGFGVIACQGVVPPAVSPTSGSPCPGTSAAGQAANPSGNYTLNIGNTGNTDHTPWFVRPYWNSIALQPAVQFVVMGNVTQDFVITLGDVTTFTGSVTGPPPSPTTFPIGMGVVACLDGYGAPTVLFGCSRVFARFLQGSGAYTLYVPPGSYNLSALVGAVSAGAPQGPLAAPQAGVNFSVTNADLGTVSGHVTMSDSSPLPFQTAVRACLVQVGLAPCLGSRSFPVQPDGSYSAQLPAPPGGTTTWDVAPIMNGGTTNLATSVQRIVTPGAASADADFSISPSVFGQVAGHVTLTGASGVHEAVRVAACPTGWPVQFYAFCQPSTSLDVNGDYLLNRVAPGSYKIVVVVGGQAVQVSPVNTTVVSGATTTGPNFTVDVSGYALLSADIDVGGQSVIRSFVAACPAPGTPANNGLCSNGPPISITNTIDGHVATLVTPGSWNVLGVAETTPNTFVFTTLMTVQLVADETLECTFTPPLSGDSSAACGFLAGDVIQTVSDGGVVTTDPGGVGATADVPVQTQIDVPSGVSGEFTVTPQPAGPSPSGFVLFGTEVVLTGPGPVAAATPYEVTFTIDSSALGGVAPADVQVLRNSVAVANCTVAGQAVPDPCVAGRSAGSGGDALVTVRTTQFSTWSFGRLATPQSKDDCKNGGWQHLADAQGRPFKNQGDCVSYVATGGKNKAKG